MPYLSKYLLFQSILTFLLNYSNCKLPHTNKKKTSRVYLSDVMKKFESEPQNSLFNQSTHVETSAYQPESESQDEWAPASSAYCRPIFKKYTIKIGSNCQSVDYNMIECNGYCHSQSMIWKNHGEVNFVSCCTLSKVNQKLMKIYCSKRLEPDQIKNELYQKMKDSEVFNIFQNSFSKSAWTDQAGYKGKQYYGGYFSVLVSYNATCECEYL